MISEVF